MISFPGVPLLRPQSSGVTRSGLALNRHRKSVTRATTGSDHGIHHHYPGINGMSDDKSTFAGAALSDVLSLLSLPGGSLAGATLQKLFERRRRMAHEVLIEELGRGSVTLASAVLSDRADDAVAMIMRYMRAAEEGAARLNLRLMAQVIAGQQQLPTLTADEFLYHAAIIAALRREEIILLGTLFRHWLSHNREPDDVARTGSTLRATKASLIPRIFVNEAELTATMAAITRTGLLVPGSAFGGISYSLSPLMVRLNELAPFEAAIQREGLHE